MISKPRTHSVNGVGTKADPIHVRVIREANGVKTPWWAITAATVAVSFMTQRFLASRFK